MPLLNKGRTGTAGRKDGRVEECVYEENMRSEKNQKKAMLHSPEWRATDQICVCEDTLVGSVRNFIVVKAPTDKDPKT